MNMFEFFDIKTNKFASLNTLICRKKHVLDIFVILRLFKRRKKNEIKKNLVFDSLPSAVID
jgi:hypothetical protein